MRLIPVLYEGCADQNIAWCIPLRVLILLHHSTRLRIRQWLRRLFHLCRFYFLRPWIYADAVGRLIGGCCDYERSATYSRFEASSIAPTSQPTLQIVAQPLLLLQHPATHYYDSHLPSAMPGYQNLNSQFPPSSHANSHHHYKSPVNKTTRSSSALGSLSSSSIDNEGRTVHVYNLSYTVSQQAIKEYFASAGVVDRFLFKKCPSKYKAVAAITFRTPQQAQTAIQQFDRNIWNGYKLRVRLNRGPDASVVRNITSSMTPGKRAGRELRDGPVVVNGSGPSMSNRRGSVCSDDESSS